MKKGDRTAAGLEILDVYIRTGMTAVCAVKIRNRSGEVVGYLSGPDPSYTEDLMISSTISWGFKMSDDLVAAFFPNPKKTSNAKVENTKG